MDILLLMKTIVWTPKAYRQLKKIKDAFIRDEIYESVQDLENFPECLNVKKLVNMDNLYRLRVKRYRVIFSDSLEIISVEEVKKRDESTY